MIHILVAALLAASPPQGPSRPVWATITRAPANGSEQVSLEFGTLGAVSQAPYRLAYYARRTVARRNSATEEIAWADSRSCPALTEVLADLRDVPVPGIDVPGFAGQPGGTDESITLDGVTYRFALSERLAFSTNVGSPLSRWTEASLQRLEPCWRAEVPRDVG
jgi:hypothetical protein